MNLVELDRALRKLRLSGMADVLETRLLQAQTDRMAPLDLVSTLVSDELLRRQDRLFERRTTLCAKVGETRVPPANSVEGGRERYRGSDAEPDDLIHCWFPDCGGHGA